jgi:hypothetical protein
MTKTASTRGLLRRDAVRLIAHPALVECSHDAGRPGGSITVVPLLDAERVVGFEIRCACGSSAVVECVYPNEADHDPH